MSSSLMREPEDSLFQPSKLLESVMIPKDDGITDNQTNSSPPLINNPNTVQDHNELLK
jgi:hypothetical protein